jgi:hypothetical protein
MCVKDGTIHHLYCVFLYIHPPIIDKDLFECQKVSVFHVLFCVCLSSRDLFNILLHFFCKSYILLFLLVFQLIEELYQIKMRES